MQLPTKQHLRTFGTQTWMQFICMGGPLHPEPRMYKHYWRVFTVDSAWEGREFLEKESPLCTADYVDLIRRLQREKKSCMVYGYKVPRQGSIFDPSAAKWSGVQFAPSWDDDTDRAFEGHK